MRRAAQMLAVAGVVWAGSAAANSDASAANPAAPVVAADGPAALVAGFAAAVAVYRSGDAGAAFAQFLALSRQGMPQAQFNLALLYRAGEGAPRNRREALYWAWRARIGGVVQAELLVADLAAAVPPEQRNLLADRLLADLAAARAQAQGRLIAASALIEAELRPEPDALLVYGWYSIAAALSATGAAAARDASFAALSPEDQAVAEDEALQAFIDWCAALTTPAPACVAAAP